MKVEYINQDDSGNLPSTRNLWKWPVWVSRLQTLPWWPGIIVKVCDNQSVDVQVDEKHTVIIHIIYLGGTPGWQFLRMTVWCQRNHRKELFRDCQSEDAPNTSKGYHAEDFIFIDFLHLIAWAKVQLLLLISWLDLCLIFIRYKASSNCFSYLFQLQLQLNLMLLSHIDKNTDISSITLYWSIIDNQSIYWNKIQHNICYLVWSIYKISFSDLIGIYRYKFCVNCYLQTRRMIYPSINLSIIRLIASMWVLKICMDEWSPTTSFKMPRCLYLVIKEKSINN